MHNESAPGQASFQHASLSSTDPATRAAAPLLVDVEAVIAKLKPLPANSLKNAMLLLALSTTAPERDQAFGMCQGHLAAIHDRDELGHSDRECLDEYMRDQLADTTQWLGHQSLSTTP